MLQLVTFDVKKRQLELVFKSGNFCLLQTGHFAETKVIHMHTPAAGNALHGRYIYQNHSILLFPREKMRFLSFVFFKVVWSSENNIARLPIN